MYFIISIIIIIALILYMYRTSHYYYRKRIQKQWDILQTRIHNSLSQLSIKIQNGIMDILNNKD